MQTVFFPSNKLNASVCNLYNGHEAAFNWNTDRLKDGKFAVAELESCRNSLRITSFLNSLFETFGENDPLTYGAELKALDSTGIWNWGIYFGTNSWWNPFTNVVEGIPNYGGTVWTSAGAAFWNAHGANVTVGGSKPNNYPNHGGNIYTLTNGQMGWNNATGAWGATNGSEILVWAQKQIELFQNLFGKRLTNISYMNGITSTLPPMMIPYFIAGRNSAYSAAGDAVIDSGIQTRVGANNHPISCRAWDAQRAGQFATQADAIAYSCAQLQRAIDSVDLTKKAMSEFAHTHSFYEFNDLPFIGTYTAAIRGQIGTQDVWQAGWGELFEYMFLRDSIKKCGSFVSGNDVYVSYHVKDRFKGTSSYGIDNAIPFETLTTPISLQIDLTGTPLAGQNIICPSAKIVRNMGSNVWVISTPYKIGADGYGMVKLSAGTQKYYSATRPTITRSGNVFTSDIPAKWVIWRKPTDGGLETIDSIVRGSLNTNFTQTIEPGFNYYVGAVSEFQTSSLIEV